MVHNAQAGESELQLFQKFKRVIGASIINGNDLEIARNGGKNRVGFFDLARDDMGIVERRIDDRNRGDGGILFMIRKNSASLGFV